MELALIGRLIIRAERNQGTPLNFYSRTRNRPHSSPLALADQQAHFYLTMPPNANISKKRKFVADGVFYAELNEVNAFRILCVLFLLSFFPLAFFVG